MAGMSFGTTIDQIIEPSRLFGAGSGDMHRMDLECIESGAYRRIGLAETAGFGFVFHFQHTQAESAGGREDRAENKQLAGVKVLLKVAAMFVHQALLFCGDVVRKRWTGRNELEKVVLPGHSGIVARPLAHAGDTISAL